jgi:hypothetical protein
MKAPIVFVPQSKALLAVRATDLQDLLPQHELGFGRLGEREDLPRLRTSALAIAPRLPYKSDGPHRRSPF